MAEANRTATAPVAPSLIAAARGEVVTIFVGAKKRSYIVHKALICHHSEYFRTAYNGRWKEAKHGVTLEDVAVEVEVFNLFLHWLYVQSLPSHNRSLLQIAEADESSSNLLLLKACGFGDRFLIPPFQQLAHNIFISLNDQYTGIRYEYIIWAFENLPEDDLMLSFMVDMQCLDWSKSNDDKEQQTLWNQLPYSFLLRVMLKHGELKDLPDSKKKRKLNVWAYYKHGGGAVQA